MRMRRRLTGAIVVVAASVGFAGAAQAAVTSQTLTVGAFGVKQEVKKRGSAGLDVNIATAETAPTDAAQTAAHTDLDLDPDFAISPGRLPQCSVAALSGTTTEQAKAACPGAQVAFGDATLCFAAAGCAMTPGGGIPVTITGFNGVPSGGAPTLLLHSKPGGIAAANPPLVLVGTLLNSPSGGKRLSVEVPDTSSTGLHLTNFHTVVPKMKSSTATKGQKRKCSKAAKKSKSKKQRNAKRKKCIKGKDRFYISARCSGDRTWRFSETTQFRAGAPTQSSSTAVACKQKVKKKKKKGKKKK